MFNPQLIIIIIICIYNDNMKLISHTNASANKQFNANLFLNHYFIMKKITRMIWHIINVIISRWYQFSLIIRLHFFHVSSFNQSSLIDCPFLLYRKYRNRERWRRLDSEISTVREFNRGDLGSSERAMDAMVEKDRWGFERGLLSY